MTANAVVPEADLKSDPFDCSLMANGGILFGLSDPRSQPQGESTMMTEHFYCACVCTCMCMAFCDCEDILAVGG